MAGDELTPIELARQGFTFISAGEYVQAEACFRRAADLDTDCFLACFGQVVIANIGNGDEQRICELLERMAAMYPTASAEERASARDLIRLEHIDTLADSIPLLMRAAENDLTSAEQMLVELGASPDSIFDYRDEHPESPTPVSKERIVAVVIAVVLIGGCLLLYSSGSLPERLQTVLLVLAFIAAAVVMAFGFTSRTRR